MRPLPLLGRETSTLKYLWLVFSIADRKGRLPRARSSQSLKNKRAMGSDLEEELQGMEGTADIQGENIEVLHRPGASDSGKSAQWKKWQTGKPRTSPGSVNIIFESNGPYAVAKRLRLYAK